MPSDVRLCFGELGPVGVRPSAALGPTFRCGAFLFVALALADSSSARLTTCKPQNTPTSYRSITNRHQPPTICSTNKSLLNTKKGFAERTSPRLFSENSMPNQARLKLDYGADEIAYLPTTKGRSREAYPPTEGRCRRQSLEWRRNAPCRRKEKLFWLFSISKRTGEK